MDTEKKICRKPIDEKNFLKVWIDVYYQNGTVEDVATAVGCSYTGAKMKEQKLRKAYVLFPELKNTRKSRSFDVASLNKLVQEKLG